MPIMNITEQHEEMRKMLLNSQQGSWELVKEKINGFDVAPESVKEILELVFKRGYQMGSQFVTAYFAKEMLTAQLESMLGKSPDDSDESCESPITDQILHFMKIRR